MAQTILNVARKSHIIKKKQGGVNVLVRFAVENFMSYKERQIFSMVAGKQTKHKNHVIEIQGKRLLRGSFLWGANAAGKSNLFSAIQFAKNIVQVGVQRGDLTNKHFRIEEGYVDKPGVFQFDIATNGHLYSYGFAISYRSATIVEEWLYLCDSSEKIIFERSIENGRMVINKDVEFKDSANEQVFTIFAENVPDEKLLLSEISERKLIEMDDFFPYRDVRDWFENLMILTPKTRRISSDDLLEEEQKVFRDFDTGIVNINLKREKMEDVLDFLPHTIKEDLMSDIEQSFASDEKKGKKSNVSRIVRIGGKSFKFQKKDNQIYVAQRVMDHGNPKDLFQLSDESDGTQRLFDLVPLYREGKQNHVIFVDELDRSFHTKLVQKYIEQFYSMTEGAESQLIASVHDSNVMDLNLLRQDEIWFVERQKDHSTQIYSLNRFQERYDKKVSKDYLLGRYGAIPCFSQIDDEAKE